MARYRYLVVVALLTGVCLVSSAQVAPPETGKLSSGLFEAASSLRERGGLSGEPIPSLSAMLILEGGSTEDRGQALEAFGYTVEAAFGPFALVSAPGDVYIDEDRGIDAVSFVSNAMLPPTVISNEFRTTGSAPMGADTAHDLGFRGQGTRIAIIDGEFMPDDPSWEVAGATYCLVTPQGLPALDAYIEEGLAAQEGPHGAACALIAADVAPEAELFLLSFPQNTSLIGWLHALDYAVWGLHADIVSTSLEFPLPTCHADGTGALNEAVNGILEGSDVVLVIAAGNWAHGSGSDRAFYEGTYNDSDNDSRHDFTVGAAESWDLNTLRFSGHQGDLVQIVLEWNDWDRELGAQDLDLVLSTDAYEKQVDASRGGQFGTSAWPFEAMAVELPYTADYCLTVENRAARWHDVDPGTLSFHINLSNLTQPFAFVEHSMARSSVREIATSDSVIAVGAVPADGTDLFSYSSRGPTSDGRPKPDLCAPAGVTGTCYEVFHGTSASAPYAAGALAVLQSAFPDMSAADRLGILTSTARETLHDDGGVSVYIIDLEVALQEVAE